ncbi:N-acetyltransferase [Ramlibacter sp. WS9]|uniref:GNAT family N-acetyltransferase n=1 Tax=Ramlibacter sp. WS9 TaxID=1882741 RepID=UPI001143336F|nr:GNAT family N-acetyltransferase [Ramlibacter sp. WS9]ROZ69010.1 GNAT family N-acetyltransferase [Ramlibacter sp. WS9]
MPAPATPYRIEALGKTHERAAFTCGSAALDRYLQQQARQDAEKSVAAPFVLTTPPARQVLGYYTLSASLVNASELPNTLAKKLPRHPQLPVTLLGRLAVDQSMKGKGIGQLLLMDALRRSLEAATHIAAMAVLVDAKDDAAQAFYRHFSFLPLHEQPRRLFLPMKTVVGLFDD